MGDGRMIINIGLDEEYGIVVNKPYFDVGDMVINEILTECILLYLEMTQARLNKDNIQGLIETSVNDVADNFNDIAVEIVDYYHDKKKVDFIPFVDEGQIETIIDKLNTNNDQIVQYLQIILMELQHNIVTSLVYFKEASDEIGVTYEYFTISVEKTVILIRCGITPSIIQQYNQSLYDRRFVYGI